MNQPSIRTLRVLGLHDQFDVELTLSESLNVIYGKNGRGKTTILHILANVLELDFRRFRYLQFKSILIETHQGSRVTIEQEPSLGGRILIIEVNGERLSPIFEESGSLSEAEESLIRTALGPRAVYLPAFRAILERVGAEPHAYTQRDPQRQMEYESIVASERAINASSDLNKFRLHYSGIRGNEQHQATAVKTTQCRQWFGGFVPVIRYPALTDVKARLVAELRDAQMQMADVEQRVFSDSFIRVFEAIAGKDVGAASGTKQDLLQEVAGLLEKIKSNQDNPHGDGVYSRIFSAVSRIDTGEDLNEETTSRVLALYVELLKRRSSQQEALFKKIGDFEISVNKFLDGKTFVVDGEPNGRFRGPTIISDTGRPLPNLSSLSSGERQVLTMVFCASRMGVDKGIFLVDEPELSLHVDWQRDILGEVMRQAGDRQVIACTHSPEVGADHGVAIQMFEPRLTVLPTGADIPEDEAMVDE